MGRSVSILDFGAFGDGLHDDRAAIQSALDSGASEVVIPIGCYKVSATLYVHSDTRITADRCAHIMLSGGERKRRGDFLLSNADTTGYNENIELVGGIWDGCSREEENDKPDIFDLGGYSGTVLNFCGVRRLKILGVTVKNSTTYHIRMSRIEDFIIEDVDFASDEFAYNQDGLHFGGEVRRGVVRNIRSLTRGQTNDDMIALNADDSVERVENLDIVRGAIEDITFENIYAENCYTVIRMLSVTAPIRNIRMKNVYAGYRNYVINGDGARYCRTPLFSENEYPSGVGRVSNILIENLVVHPATEPIPNKNSTLAAPERAIRLECLCDNFEIRNCRFENAGCDAHALFMTNVTSTEVVADGTRYLLSGKSDSLTLDSFVNLTVNTVSK